MSVASSEIYPSILRFFRENELTKSAKAFEKAVSDEEDGSVVLSDIYKKWAKAQGLKKSKKVDVEGVLYPLVLRFLNDNELSKVVKAFRKETSVEEQEDAAALSDIYAFWVKSQLETNENDAVDCNQADETPKKKKKDKKNKKEVAEDEVAEEEAVEEEVPKKKKKDKKKKEEVVEEEEVAEEEAPKKKKKDKKKKEEVVEEEEVAEEEAPKKKKKDKKEQVEEVAEESAEETSEPVVSTKRKAPEVVEESWEEENWEQPAKQAKTTTMNRFSRVDDSKWRKTIEGQQWRMDFTHESKARFGSGGGDAWGDAAAADMIKVKGKGFRKEMQKKKRASWRGAGELTTGVNSMKFESDSD